MRRFRFWGNVAVVLLTVGFAISKAVAVERCVLVELMTFVNCLPGCPYAEAALDSLTGEYPDSFLAVIRYHPSTFPANPFYQPESYFRWKYYYGQTTFPVTCFDGGMMVVGAFEDTTYDVYKDSIEVRRAIPSPLSMSLSVYYDSTSRMGLADVRAIAVDSVGPGDLHLRYALLESGLEHDEEIYEEVVRDMYPDTTGVSFSIAQGDTFQNSVGFTLDPLWLAENCGLVAFVQDDVTKEVMQSTQRWYPQWTPPPPIPAAVEDLQVTLCQTQLYLSWSPVTEDWFGRPLSVDYYRIYGAATPYIDTGAKTLIDSTEEVFYLDEFCDSVGDPELNCSYYVTAVAEGLESSPSNVTGEFDVFLDNDK